MVEDEKKLSHNIAKGLKESGFAVDQAFDGEQGLFLAQSETYSCIILDLMLPKIDGISLCRQIRKENNVPILMLTAKSQVENKVEGLDAGADDYLTKPFEFAELKARINAMTRRKNNPIQTIIKIADLEIDPSKHKVKRSGNEVELTPKEFAILQYLAVHKDEVVTRTQIMEQSWDYNFESFSNIIDVFIATLRKKIDGNSKKRLIHTIHGVGYKLAENE